MVSEDEWAILKDNFSVDREICVIRNKADSSEFLLTSDPSVCDDCLAKRCREEEEEQLVYRNVTVYVRRLTGAEIPPEKDPSDPDFDCMNGSTKRFRMSNGSSISSPNNGNNCSSASDFVRRSNRRQKVRGEREFTVSSDMLLRDFKIKVTTIILFLKPFVVVGF
jgi:hypothetical protein